MDEKGSSGVLQVIGAVLGIAGLGKGATVILGKAFDRYTTRDKYRHEHEMSSEDRAWKQVHELREEARKREQDLDSATLRMFEAITDVKLMGLKLEAEIAAKNRTHEENDNLKLRLRLLEEENTSLRRRLDDQRPGGNP